MASSKRLLLVLIAWPRLAMAQQTAQGFAVERFYPSAPGGGWFVMDEMNIGGGLGGAISLTGGYARNPFAPVVSNEAFVDVAMAVTYNRFRVYLDLPMPVVVNGSSRAGPSLNIATSPDSVADSHVGFDMRLLGKPGSSFRLGTGAQLIIPSGSRADYVTDGRYGGMFRLLPAGDIGRFSYAGQLGLYVRPAEGLLVPGSPDGNEVLFGLAAGRRFPSRSGWDTVVGPEFFGEASVHSASDGRTGFEGLLSTRLERTGDRPHLRFKIGIGHGIVEHFGAPEWRVLASLELVGSRL